MQTDIHFKTLGKMIHVMDMGAFSDRFTGESKEDFITWQEKEREVLSTLTGVKKLLEMEDADASRNFQFNYDVFDVEKTECGILRKKVLLTVDADTCIPMYIIEPRENIKGTFLALSGHQSGGKAAVAGVRDNPKVAEKIDFYNYDYGLKLARLGFVAICPDPRGFGERGDMEIQPGQADDPLSCTCRNISNMAIPMGLSVIGLNVYDLIRIIDFIHKSKKWDTENLGCLGFSGGGMQALFLSAIDERVKMTFISGYMYGYREALMELHNNCSCNYVPGLWEKLDMGDIGSLIAPRSLFIQSCRDDHLNGKRGIINVNEQVEIIRKAYKLVGKNDALIHDIREGDHHFYDEPLGETIESFLIRQ